MRPRKSATALLALLLGASSVAYSAPTDQASRWKGHLLRLSSDEMEGRLAGSAGYDRAARHVIAVFRELGLQPAGTNGYLQPVGLEEQYVDTISSTVSLARDDASEPLRIGEDLVIGTGYGPRPARVDGPLVFLGYGLHLPEVGHDDFVGTDLKGKIAVVVAGGPPEISGALKAHARAERAKLLEQAGAAGVITINTPKTIEIPWPRVIPLGTQPGMYFADPKLREVRGEFFMSMYNPGEAEKIFARSGHSFAEVVALAEASRPLPRFDLNQRLQAQIVTRRRLLSSPNVVAKLSGSDSKLAAEYVIVSAHLDHLGIGEPNGRGDKIYNGAVDNAAGVASLLDIAETYRRTGTRPKRSILFVALTAEEKGLLGSRYFALRPTVPARSIVADLNLDMAMPLWPLKSVIVFGADESSLGAAARAAGKKIGLPLVPDPFPERNHFIRSDQYSFIRSGIPSLAFRFGHAGGTAEGAIAESYLNERYHAPADDTNQAILAPEAVKLDNFVANVVLRTANAPSRPEWLPQSFFRRFAAAGR